MRIVEGKLYDDQQYCEKCGAPFIGAPHSRFGRRRAWINTISPDIKFSKTYEVCMECIFRIEAYLEHRTSGRLRIVEAKTTKAPLISDY